MKRAGLAAFAATLGVMTCLPAPAAPALAQSAEDECIKVARKAPYAKQRAAFDKCMAEKTKGKEKKG